MPKIGQKNLFNTKRSSSQIDIKHPIKNSYSSKNNDNYSLKKVLNKNHDFIIAKDKNKEKEFNHRNSINLSNYKKIKLGKNIFTNKSKIITQKPGIVGKESPNIASNTSDSKSPFLSKISASPDIFQKRKNESKIKLSPFSLFKDQGKNTPFQVQKKMKNEIEEMDEFVLYDMKDNEDSSSNFDIITSKMKDKSNEGKNNNENEGVNLYKYNEVENSDMQKLLIKYYAIISEKEILFFSSESKDELCDMWFIYNSFITTGSEIINNINYYTINIIYNNSAVNKLYFTEEKICTDFSKKIKKSINNLNFGDYYEIEDKIGHGHFGKVCKCKNKSDGKIYAVKIVNKLELKQMDLKFIQQEKNYLKLIKHPNIIFLKDYFENQSHTYFVTDYYGGGDILTFIDEKHKENANISEKTAAKIIRKVAEGIKYLNNFGILHRDIKPENIMFEKKNDIKTLKIIDLGVCQTLSYGELASQPIGTNGYIPPEIYLHNKYSFKIDI